MWPKHLSFILRFCFMSSKQKQMDLTTSFFLYFILKYDWVSSLSQKKYFFYIFLSWQSNRTIVCAIGLRWVFYIVVRRIWRRERAIWFYACSLCINMLSRCYQPFGLREAHRIPTYLDDSSIGKTIGSVYVRNCSSLVTAK